MKKLAPLFVIVGASLWGVDGIVLRPALYGLPVPLVVFIESSIVAILLTTVFARQIHKVKLLDRGDWLAFIGVAIFGGALGTMAITRALFYVNFVNLSIVILMQKLQPAFALGLAALILKERLPGVFFFWTGVALTGAYLMTFGAALPGMETGDKTVEAALFALLAALSFGFSTVLSKRALKNVDFGLGTYLRFLFTAILLFPFVLLMGYLPDISKISGHQAAVFMIIAFTTGGPAIFLYYYGLKKISASVAAICELSFPLTAVVLEYILRGHLLGFTQWIGVLLLFFSIIKVSNIRTAENDT